MIGLSMIIKDETDTLITLGKSIEGLFDQRVAVVSGNNPETDKILTELGFEIYHEEWKDDFAYARNIALSKMNTDWVMWLDADDVLEGKIVLPEYGNAIYAEYVFDKGVPILRERIVKKDTHKWKGILHEYLDCDNEIKVLTDTFKVIHNHDYHTREERDIRNLRLAIKAYELEKNFHSVYYYARTLKEVKKFKEALDIYEEYFKLEVHDHYRYTAYIEAGECALFIGDLELCRSYASKAMGMFPIIGASYFLTAKSFFKENDWEQALKWLEKGFSKHEPDNWIVPVNRDEYRNIPLNLYKLTMLNLNEAYNNKLNGN